MALHLEKKYVKFPPKHLNTKILLSSFSFQFHNISSIMKITKLKSCFNIVQSPSPFHISSLIYPPHIYSLTQTIYPCLIYLPDVHQILDHLYSIEDQKVFLKIFYYSILS